VERSFPSPSPILGRAQAAATFPWARPATVCSRSGAAFHRHRQANRVLIFAGSDAVDALPPFVANAETLERGVIYGPGGLDTDVAFPTHALAARRYFASRGIAGNHAFAAR
jgi:hypothetical protein